MQMIGEGIKQVTVFKKSGPCVLNLDYWGARLNEQLFSSLLSAINSFSLEALGLELCEISTQEYHVFLSRTKDLIIAVVVEESACDDPKIKSSILSLVERICQILESIDHSHPRTNPQLPEWLHKKIQLEIAQVFPTFWNPFTLNEQFLSEISQIRILTHLSDQKKHTMTEIKKRVYLTRPIIKKKLFELDQEGLITIEKIPFGRRERIKYIISEMGKLILDNLETRFPGLWF